MDKKDNKEKDMINVVADGVEQGITNFLYHVSLIVFVFMILFLILAVAVDKYETYQYENNPDYIMNVPVTTPVYSTITGEFLNCHIVAGNGTEQEIITYFSINGYGEANAKYEQMIPQIERKLTEERPTWSVFWLECD